jgi:hypothetical protein
MNVSDQIHFSKWLILLYTLFIWSAFCFMNEWCKTQWYITMWVTTISQVKMFQLLFDTKLQGTQSVDSSKSLKLNSLD